MLKSLNVYKLVETKEWKAATLNPKKVEYMCTKVIIWSGVVSIYVDR